MTEVCRSVAVQMSTECEVSKLEKNQVRYMEMSKIMAGSIGTDCSLLILLKESGDGE